MSKNSFDTVLENGTVYDGTGSPGSVADIGIIGDRIEHIGNLKDADSAQRINAQGLAVSPGFIDIHTHYDAQIVWDPKLSVSPWHGITTVVLGNCGFGIAPTHPEHRPIILRTLEKVEGMNLDALETGLAEWPFKTFPEYMDAIEKRGT